MSVPNEILHPRKIDEWMRKFIERGWLLTKYDPLPVPWANKCHHATPDADDIARADDEARAND